MNKLFIAMTAVSALAVAAPAAAQQYQGSYNAQSNTGSGDRLARLDARINAGVQAGTIDQREAWNLRQQLREISRLERRYSRNGISQQERADLQYRLRNFREQLRMADGRAYGNGQYGQNGSNNGYDNGYDDGYQGQGGPYEEACDSRGSSSGGGVLGGIIDSIFGGNTNNNYDCDATLRVGQRASGNLYGVPAEYRNQFRDGYGVYYRSDGRAIYQIDARTQTVLRVYDMNR
ncbi:MAG TPA: hypothetical protein VF727_03725 [Allosphingosinicella sp.]|jgi:hypothetical protein